MSALDDYLRAIEEKNQADVAAYLSALNAKAAWPGAGAATPTEQQQKDANAKLANAQMKKFLGDYGLEALNDRLWAYIVENGVDDENQLLLWVSEQAEYKARFPAMDALAKKGRAISAAQYIQLERTYKQVFHEFGIPESFYDSNGDFTALITNEVSPAELQARVQDGYSKVANADPRVREQFARYFGVNGDTALAAFFIDPARALPKLEAAVAAAEVSGAAASLSFNLDLNAADRLARMGVSYDQAMQGFTKMSLTRDLFERSIGDTDISVNVAPTSDLGGLGSGLGNEGINGATPLPGDTTLPGAAGAGAGGNVGDPTDQATELGMAYTFGTDGEAQRDLRRRLDQRRAAVGAEVQGDTVSRDGKGALGAAE